MNQSTELYLLSPLAWTHAQDLLARESEMIARGIGAKNVANFSNANVSASKGSQK
ncbi:MAG: hypothetical protein SGJ05_05215 [bacterium]|nr:hypothetical protein [bacterium]